MVVIFKFLSGLIRAAWSDSNHRNFTQNIIMSRASKVTYLKPEQRVIVEACIRHNLYVNTMAMVVELTGKGITLSKSSLNRYAAKLRKRDAQEVGTSGETLVIIVERATGAVTSLMTNASSETVANLVTNISTP